MSGDAYNKANLIFLDEIAKQSADLAGQVRQHPELVQQIVTAAVMALCESLSASTSQTVEAIRSLPCPESLVGPLAALQNAVVIQGNRQQDLLKMVGEAVRAIRLPAPAQPVKRWKVTPDRNYDTGLIQSVIIEAVG